MPGHFDDVADQWTAWARTPGHDPYQTLSRPGFWPILPAPSGLTLDVGCGEGRLTRDLAAAGHHVVGVDLSERLVRAAAQADPGGHYLLSDAAALPVRDGGADLVVSFNVLMDVFDLPGACAELSRVLAPHGRVCVCITHPFTDCARPADETDPLAPFVVTGSYPGRQRVDVSVARSGLRMQFAGWARSLAVYLAAFQHAGLVVEALLEPLPDDAAIARQPWLARFRRLPMFLVMRLTHADGCGGDR